MYSKSSLQKSINLKRFFQKLDNKGSLLIPNNLKITDTDFYKYRHLPVNWEINPVTGKDLPDEFSAKAVKLVDLFRRKTFDLDYEIMLFFDYITAELIYCFVNDKGNSNEVFGIADENIFECRHIASIHNHPHDYLPALSFDNFQMLSFDFEEYELVSSFDSLWILKFKSSLPPEEVNDIKKDIKFLYEFSIVENRFDCEIYEKLLINYINNLKFDINLTKRCLS